MCLVSYLIASHEVDNLERATIDNGRDIASAGARMFADVLESEIDHGSITLTDVLSPSYVEIKGYDFGDQPRFHTSFDALTDRTVLGIQDGFLEANPDVLYAVGADKNGYIPTHNSAATLPLTGQRGEDRIHYRSKRKFTDPVAAAVARNVEPSLVQSYARDTGEQAWDVSAPIFVKGQHFGGFRVGISVASITAYGRALWLRLTSVFCVLAIIVIGFIFVLLQRAMKPLQALAGLADEISLGERLEQPIKPSTTDEIGQMAGSLNRLRASLQVAMHRLDQSV
jgi:HAMP domain-containing protein